MSVFVLVATSVRLRVMTGEWNGVCVCFVTEHHVKKTKRTSQKKKYTISLGLARETWLRCRKHKCSLEGKTWGLVKVAGKEHAGARGDLREKKKTIAAHLQISSDHGLLLGNGGSWMGKMSWLATE